MRVQRLFILAGIGQVDRMATPGCLATDSGGIRMDMASTRRTTSTAVARSTDIVEAFIAVGTMATAAFMGIVVEVSSADSAVGRLVAVDSTVAVGAGNRLLTLTQTIRQQKTAAGFVFKT